MIKYRYYKPGDEKEIVKLWNKTLWRDPITSERFRNLVLLDVNFDPKGLRLAFDDTNLKGVVYAVRRLTPMAGTELEPDNGWIPFFFVEKVYRNQDIGTTLLNEAIDFLRKNGRKNVFFASYAPNYIMPGIDEGAYPAAYKFLESKGFKKMYSPIAMDKQLIDFKLSNEIQELLSKREEEGYSFKFAEDKDLYEVIQFANNKFNPDWGRAIREGILRGLPLNRILIVKNKDKVVGFCLYGGYEGIPERFGPFGIDPDEQGKKLGKILLNLCLYQMKAEGLHGAWFLWTGEKTTAGYLYKKTGFEISRTFSVMKKDI
ncbi:MULTISPECIES: GNAT family N-acetyltransferase [Gracilibacillus]|uniref:GNAT family N-acetyltransferase n=1 Tax=Gracilibacillus TaxID=74385 RepID=UPI000825B58C|nr:MULTISPECIES: GNAT family N-acetyltransferase [Gracilibacillus]